MRLPKIVWTRTLLDLYLQARNKQIHDAAFPPPPPVPTIDSLTPDTGTADGGDSVVIAGTGFTGATAVTFDDADAADFTVDSDIQITATTPEHDAGDSVVTVTTPGGSATGSFTFE